MTILVLITFLLTHRHRANCVVGEECLRVKEGLKILGSVVVEFIDGADDVSDDRTQHHLSPCSFSLSRITQRVRKCGPITSPRRTTYRPAVRWGTGRRRFPASMPLRSNQPGSTRTGRSGPPLPPRVGRCAARMCARLAAITTCRWRWPRA